MSIEPRHTALYAMAATDVEKVVKHLPRLTAKSFVVFIVYYIWKKYFNLEFLYFSHFQLMPFVVIFVFLLPHHHHSYILTHTFLL